MEIALPCRQKVAKRRRIVSPFALGIVVMDESHEAYAASSRSPLQHLLVATGIAKPEDWATTDEGLDTDGLAFLVVYELRLR